MASEIFSLIYDGEEIRDGEMSVAALGPALVAMGELFEAANATLNGSQTTVETNVKADFKEGSFEVLIHIHQFLTDPSAALIPAMYVLGADQLVGQVMGKAIEKAKDKVADVAVEGLFKLLGRLGGKKPERTEYDESKKLFIYNTGNNVNITVDQATSQLYQSPKVLSAAAKVAIPLKRPDSKIRIKRDSEEIADLQQQDFPDVPDVEMPMLSDNKSSAGGPQELIVQILKPAFVEGKWSVSDGNKKYQVDMEDPVFKGRVHSREIGFYEGDLYRVELVTTQYMKNGKLSTARKITRVIEPVSAAVQESLQLRAPAKRNGRKFRDADE
ncbi:hypothetical protein [Edaphobacter dinghuensis]|uniref:Uncharacterized protein n=1 Tax=Edaphobacter dinghuensis TaxID=1560005 RepID=A0A917M333_9BACT|nr:hypothetical protein [Edaphobacter dinghuensis]GGG71923.1 hypothetical protein GCM10011585_12760 [Edaphobacter dinghuensis]